MEFTVLGTVAATRHGREITLRRKETHLLAALLAQPGRPLTADVLIEELWPDPPAATPTRTDGRPNALRVHLSHLRTALRGPDHQAEPSRLASTPHGYVLSLAPGELDSARMSTAVTQARALRTKDPQRARTLLWGADAEWRGMPFAGLDSPLVASQRTHLEVVRRQLVADLADLEASCTDPDLTRLQRWSTEDPTDEALALALARGLYRTGNPVRALDALRGYRDTLVEDWGLDPSDAVAALEKRILEHDPSLDPVTGPIQIATNGTAPALAAPPSTSAPPGREDLVRQLADTLTVGHRAALVGGRGTGRTSVARAVVAATEPGAVLLDGTPDEARPWEAVCRLLAAVGGDPEQVGQVVGSSYGSRSRVDPTGPLADLVAARLSPVRALILDDVDRLDVESLRVVRAVLDDPRSAHLGILLTATTAGGALSALTSTADLAAVAVHDLPPICLNAARSLLVAHGFQGADDDLTALATAVLAASGGHPTLAMALAGDAVRTGTVSSDPQVVREIAARILTDLGSSVGEVVVLSALDGPGVDIDLLARATQRAPTDIVDDLEAALASGLLALDPGGSIHVHHGWRPILATTLGPVQQSQAHATLAEAYAADPDVHPGDVVRHLRLAGPRADRRQLVTWLLAEARLAIEGNGLISAATLLEEVVRLAEGARDPANELIARLLLAEVLQRTGRMEASLVEADLAARQAKRLGDRTAYVAAALLLATPLLPDDGAREVAVRAVEEALDWLGPAASHDRVRLLEALIRAHSLDPSAAAEQARLHAADALAEALTAGLPSEQTTALAHLGLRYAASGSLMPVVGRRTATEGATRAARTAYGSSVHLAALRVRAVDAVLTDPETGLARIRAYREVADDVSAIHHRWLADRMEAAALLVTGHPEGAEAALARAARDEAWVDQEMSTIATVVQELSALWLGEEWDVLGEALAGELPASELFLPILPLARMAVDARRGRPIDERTYAGAVAALGAHGAHLPGYALGATVPVRTVAGRRALERCRTVLAGHEDEWIALEGGLGLLGPVREFLDVPVPQPAGRTR